MGTGKTGLPKDITDEHPEWVLYFCNFKKAWDLPHKSGGKSKGEGIIVMHPDTGFTGHPELWDDNTIIDGELEDDRYLIHKARNFMEPGQSAVDQLLKSGPKVIMPKGRAIYIVDPTITFQERFPSHGTKTASVLMSKEGRPNMDDFPNYHDAQFVSGVAPLVKVIPLKVTESVLLFAQGFIDLATSINYIVDLSKSSSVLNSDNSQIGVISISLGGLNTFVKSSKSSIKAALVEARKAGIVVVASAGQGAGEWTAKKMTEWGGAYPGNDRDNTISAAACDSMHKKYNVGYYGPSVDITAPGVKIWEAVAERNRPFLDHYYVDHSHGTSYSAAIVAGACALWQAHHGRTYLLSEYGPELIFDLFKKVLQDSSHTPQYWDTNCQGAGILDAENLLRMPLPPKSEIEAITGR